MLKSVRRRIVGEEVDKWPEAKRYRPVGDIWAFENVAEVSFVCPGRNLSMPSSSLEPGGNITDLSRGRSISPGLSTLKIVLPTAKTGFPAQTAMGIGIMKRDSPPRTPCGDKASRIAARTSSGASFAATESTRTGLWRSSHASYMAVHPVHSSSGIGSLTKLPVIEKSS